MNLFTLRTQPASSQVPRYYPSIGLFYSGLDTSAINTLLLVLVHARKVLWTCVQQLNGLKKYTKAGIERTRVTLTPKDFKSQSLGRTEEHTGVLLQPLSKSLEKGLRISTSVESLSSFISARAHYCF